MEWLAGCVFLALKVLVGWAIIVLISLVFGMAIGKVLAYCGRFDDCRPWPGNDTDRHGKDDWPR